MRPSGVFLTVALAALSVGAAARPAWCATSAKVVPGEHEFQRNCGVCHIGGRVGPALAKDLVVGREAEVRSKILDGGGQMPGFKFLLTDRDVSLIVGYLKGLETPASLIGAPRVAP